MAQSIHEGMTQEEVVSILGQPILNNTLTPNRWHYLFVEQQGSRQIRHQRLTLTFENQRVKKIEILQ